MEKYLKWEDCDKTITETYPKSGKVVERKVTRELTCSHPLVDECWQWGSYVPSGGNMTHHLEIVTKDGQRYSEEVTDQDIANANFPKAEEWLQSLNTVNQ